MHRTRLTVLSFTLLLIAVQTPAASGAAISPGAAKLLISVRTAAGPRRPTELGVLEATGVKRAYGLEARWHSAVDMKSGRFRVAADFTAFPEALVFDGEREWRVDRSGGVHPLDGAFARRRTRTDSWLRRFGYLEPDAAGAAIADPARREVDGRSYDVLVATPIDGQPVELWFDSATHLLSRDVRQDAISTVVERRSDYRAFQGIQLPYRISEGDGDDAGEITIASYVARSRAGRTDFARPRPPSDVQLDLPTTVPMEVGGYVVVEARLNGRGPMAFILDTGGHSILTPEAARALGLKAVGRSVSGGAGAGVLAQQDATVDQVQIGGAVLRKQHFYVIPLQYATVERGARPPLAGILGAELLERVAARVDYRASRLTLAPFGQAPGLCRGARTPISFDDDMPLIQGEVDGRPGVLAIDSGNGGSTVVQGVWAGQVGLTERLKGGIKTTSFGSGGASVNWVTRGGEVALGDVQVTGLDLRYASDTKGAFSSITEAANVGQQVLARFNVTFDYRHEQICLEPVAGYRPPPLNRSGLILIKTVPERFEVVGVSAGTGAADAGLAAGDAVTAVDGRPAQLLSGQDMFAILRQPPGTHVRLTLTREGQSLDKIVVLQEP